MASEAVRVPYFPILGRLSPVVPVQLFHNDGWLNDLAYVDSGAWVSVFNGFVARRLGIELETGQRTWLLAMNGHRIPAYLHRLGLSLAGFHLTVQIGFSDDLQIGFNVLGRHSIFNQLQFCFNDRDNELTVRHL